MTDLDRRSFFNTGVGLAAGAALAAGVTTTAALAQTTAPDITDPRAPRSLGDVFVGENAHSVTVDPASHRLFFPLADVKGQMVLRVVRPVTSPGG